MTTQEKAGMLVENGMIEKDMFMFFDRTNRDVTEYVSLFECVGSHIVKDIGNKVWDIYEDWQDS